MNFHKISLVIYFLCMLEASSYIFAVNHEGFKDIKHDFFKKKVDTISEFNYIGKYDDSDVGKPIEYLIKSKGYPVENHYVKTRDGFVLGLFRIPHGHDRDNSSHFGDIRPAVLLQHALLDCGTSFVNNLAHESLGFVLADRGYDVWIGNNRGNEYSRNHTYLSPDQKEFWDWTWDEMAQFDLSASVDYITEITGRETISYIGHSEGTTQAFALFSSDTDISKKVNLFIALAPAVFVSHTKSPAFVAMKEFDIWKLFDLFGDREILPSTEETKKWFPEICETVPILCTDFLFAVCGFNVGNINASRVPVYLDYTPSGTSVRNMIHWIQMARQEGVFSKYDFGTDCHKVFGYKNDCNQLRYNSTTAPVYDLGKLNVRTVVFSGGHDWLADPTDVEYLIAQLPAQFLVDHVQIPSYEHLDFSWGVNAHEKVYSQAINFLNEYNRL